jgi:hypothetical protein
MTRSELEHLIRAAAAPTNEYEILVVDSQSILGAVPNAPEALLQSMEADLYPLHRPDLADLIEARRRARQGLAICADVAGASARRCIDSAASHR